MTNRMNWSAGAGRERVQKHGGEVLGGEISGNRPARKPGRKTDRQQTRPTGPTLTETIEIAKFWKSPRDRSQHVRVELCEFKGHPLVNLRLWQTGADGIDRPSAKGIALGVRKLPVLARALAKAEAKARELGLISGDQGDGE